MPLIPIVAVVFLLGGEAATSLPVQGGVRDSVRNGAIIGAIAGGVTVAVLAAAGCATSDLLSGGDDSCGSALLVGTLIGAGIGAAIGAGIDLLIDRSPFAGPPGTRGHPRRLTLRYSLRF